MTLSKHRPLRTYDEQWIVEMNDLHGLLKDVAVASAESSESGEVAATYWKGVEDALHVMFSQNGVDSRIEFMREIRGKLEKRMIGDEPWDSAS